MATDEPLNRETGRYVDKVVCQKERAFHPIHTSFSMALDTTDSSVLSSDGDTKAPSRTLLAVG
jgi:hypothetical protein